jgi:hypothetical protein
MASTATTVETGNPVTGLLTSLVVVVLGGILSYAAARLWQKRFLLIPVYKFSYYREMWQGPERSKRLKLPVAECDLWLSVRLGSLQTYRSFDVRFVEQKSFLLKNYVEARIEHIQMLGLWDNTVEKGDSRRMGRGISFEYFSDFTVAENDALYFHIRVRPMGYWEGYIQFEAIIPQGYRAYGYQKISFR